MSYESLRIFVIFYNFSAITIMLWTASVDGTICIWDTELAKCLQKFPAHLEPVRCLAQSKNSVYSSSQDKTIVAWNKQTLQKQQIFESGHTNSITCMIIPKGIISSNILWSGSLDTTIHSWTIE